MHPEWTLPLHNPPKFMTDPPEEIGRVLEAIGGTYRIALASGLELEAVLRGRLRKGRKPEERVVAGDEVELASTEGGTWVIEGVRPRRSQLVRGGGGSGYIPKVIAANIDRLLVVSAAVDPSPNPEYIDRLLVISEAGGIQPVVVINKCDSAEVPVPEWVSIYRDLGYLVLLVSALTGVGIDDFRDQVCSGISTLVGPSGAGKSSLLNCVEPQLKLRTSELSGKGRRGRHTTVSCRLIPLVCGGAVADTPGFSEAGLWGLDAETLGSHFPEIYEKEPECRFRGCSHRQEPDCAVQAALETGQMDQGRYRSYLRFYEELSTER